VKNQKTAVVFDEGRAAFYDQGNARLAPTSGALYFLIRAVLSELPASARILCVGVGTGLELLHLAKEFPHWQFTAMETAPPMLELCRQRVEENGITSRVTFHEGYIDSLPDVDSFDAATCLFVSHFLSQAEDLRQFLTQIALRLRPNGYFIDAALACNQSSAQYKNLLETWLRMLKSFGMPVEQIEKPPDSFRQDVSVRPS